MTAPPELGGYLEWGRSPGDPLRVERRHLSLRCPEARPRWCLDREATSNFPIPLQQKRKMIIPSHRVPVPELAVGDFLLPFPRSALLLPSSFNDYISSLRNRRIRKTTKLSEMRWLAPTFPDPPRKVHSLIPISSHTGPQDELCFLSSTVLLPLLLFFSAEYQTTRWLGKGQHRLQKNSGTRPLEYAFPSFQCRSFGQGYSLVFTYYSTHRVLQEESCLPACRVLSGGGGSSIHHSMCFCSDMSRQPQGISQTARTPKRNARAKICVYQEDGTPFWAETPPSPFGYRQGTPSPKSDKLAAGCSTPFSPVLQIQYISRVRDPMTNASHWPSASLGLSNSIEVPMGRIRKHGGQKYGCMYE